MSAFVRVPGSDAAMMIDGRLVRTHREIKPLGFKPNGKLRYAEMTVIDDDDPNILLKHPNEIERESKASGDDDDE